ncbi:SRPBCC family protein [Nocardia sp. NPDC004340]
MASYGIHVRAALSREQVALALGTPDTDLDSPVEVHVRTDSRRSVPFQTARLSWRQSEYWRVTEQSIAADFEQLDGPFSSFTGSIRAQPGDSGWEIGIEIDFTTSIPNWAGAVDRAIGGAVLRAAISALSETAAGGLVVTSGPDWLDDTAGHSLAGASRN